MAAQRLTTRRSSLPSPGEPRARPRHDLRARCSPRACSPVLSPSESSPKKPTSHARSECAEGVNSVKDHVAASPAPIVPSSHLWGGGSRRGVDDDDSGRGDGTLGSRTEEELTAPMAWGAAAGLGTVALVAAVREETNLPREYCVEFPSAPERHTLVWGVQPALTMLPPPFFTPEQTFTLPLPLGMGSPSSLSAVPVWVLTLSPPLRIRSQAVALSRHPRLHGKGQRRGMLRRCRASGRGRLGLRRHLSAATDKAPPPPACMHTQARGY